MISALALATLTATPATLPAVVAKAQSGDTIRLMDGTYPRVKITDRTFAKPVTIKANPKASFQFAIARVSGLTIQGGMVRDRIGGGGAGYGIGIQSSSRITVNGVAISNGTRGIVIGRSTDVLVAKVTFDRMIVDGINIAGSQRVTIRGVICTNANSGKAHPDCIQGWSRPGMITQDVLITDSTVNTAGMQGIFFGNHVRGGVDDGGFDRIRVIANAVTVDHAQGIALYDCRKCEISGNVVTTMKGARSVASINTRGSTDLKQDGNRLIK